MIRICMIYPQLLGTYGDAGNGLVLRERLARRDVAVELLHAHPGNDIEPADIYLLGGGEDGPQRLAADLLRSTSFPSQ